MDPSQVSTNQILSPTPEPWYKKHAKLFGFGFLAVVTILVVALIYFWQYGGEDNNPPQNNTITNFSQCVSAGYAVLESYPRQCKTPDGQTFTEEITDQTTDWKTYTNTEYGFEFRYPDDWTLDDNGAHINDKFGNVLDIHLVNWDYEKQDPNNWSEWTDCNVFIGMEIQAFHPYTGPFDLFVKSLVTDKVEDMRPSGKLEKTTIAEQNAYKVENAGGEGCGGPGYFIQVSNNNYIYIFSGRGQVENQKIIDQILSTFKFIDKTSDSSGQFCGGIAGIACPAGYSCKLEGSYPDAGGVCQKD